MLSLGSVRKALQPVVFKYWLRRRSEKVVATHVEGFELDVFPGVFHPGYFGSSSILAKFVSSRPLAGLSFLEVGCGSGIVSMCAARQGAEVTAVDINPEAVRCTIANAQKHSLGMNVYLGDLFAPVRDTRFDLIVWNPPFLTGKPNSPAEAAFYGGDNFELIRRFAAEARRHLRADASVYTIVSDAIPIDKIKELFSNEGFTVSQVVSQRWGLGETMVILCAR